MGPSPTALDWLIVATVAAGGLSGASILMWILYRAAARDATKTTERVLASPWNDVAAVDRGTALIGALMATDDEMLIELEWVRRSPGNNDSTTWLTGPTSVAAILTLSRWHDSHAVVSVVPMADRILLHNEQARVCFRAVRAPNVAA